MWSTSNNICTCVFTYIFINVYVCGHICACMCISEQRKHLGGYMCVYVLLHIFANTVLMGL